MRKASSSSESIIGISGTNMIDLKKASCVLVTGGCGFIGSYVVNLLLREYPHLRVLNVDKLTYAADPSRIKETSQYVHFEEDVAVPHVMERIFNDYGVDAVIHLAAESHVDNSIRGGIAFIDTNVKGTAVIMEALKERKIPILFVSTDEVYGEAEGDREFVEEAPLAPRNPYSASKAAAELVVKGYGDTFGVPYVITRGSNTYGIHQHPEKLIPKSASLLRHGLPALLYGDGAQQREWLHAEDHASGIAHVLQLGTPGETYNIGSGVRASNKVVIEQISRIGKDMGVFPVPPSIEFIEDRLGHDFRYAIDSTKLRELGWQPAHLPGKHGPLEDETVAKILLETG